MKVVLVTNIPVPYREKVYEHISNEMDSAFHVIYCNRNEPDRNWEYKEGNYCKTFLKGFTFSYKKLYLHHVHMNIGIWRALNDLNPRVVINTGYNPTNILAFLWTVLHRRKHITMSDGWLKSEIILSRFHRILRKIFVKKSSSFIGASAQSVQLFIHYGAKPEKCFQSHLCGNNDLFLKAQFDRKWDLLFSGQFIERKMPIFFCDVIEKLLAFKKDLNVLLIGSGPELQKTLKKLDSINVQYKYAGFIQQDFLPEYYCSSKVFLFPTMLESWGVVINEACAAGTPVISCENTAAAHELVISGKNGYILPLDSGIWAEKILELLEDQEKWRSFSDEAKSLCMKYTYQNAAHGIMEAIKTATAS